MEKMEINNEGKIISKWKFKYEKEYLERKARVDKWYALPRKKKGVSTQYEKDNYKGEGE